MKDYKITDKSKIIFHCLNQRQEGDEYFIGRDDIGSYVAMRKLGAEVIELLKRNLSVGEVKHRLKEEYKEEIEVAPFLETLIQLGFVKEIDGYILEDKIKKKKYLFTRIKTHHVKWLFSRPALIIYALVISFALFIMGVDHSYIPRYEDLFFHPRFTVVMLISFALHWLLMFKHEMAHFFAMKSLGLEGRFSLSNRLYFVVAETDMNQLWMRPRKDRYLPYLAGMMSDVVTASGLIIVLWAADTGFFELNMLVYEIFKLIILAQLVSFLWQFQFFMRTDIYYVVATLLNCKNLFNDAQIFFRNKILEVLGRNPAPLRGMSEKEMKAIRIYSIFYGMGTILLMLIFFFYAIPITVTFTMGVYHNLVAGYTLGNKEAFIDGVVVLSIIGFYWVLLLVLILRKRWAK